MADWKQYASVAEGDRGDYWQRLDGRAEVFSDPVYPGWRGKVWRLYKRSKRPGKGRFVAVAIDCATPEEAMAVCDKELVDG